MNIPHPSRKNLKRRHAGNRLKKVAITDEVKMMTVEPKVCATTSCIWCGTDFERPSIRCRVCGNCQYCGTFCQSPNYCTTCGNHTDDELRVDRKKRVVRFQPQSDIIKT